MMSTYIFIDKKQREIKIVAEEDGLTARYEGQEIGKFDYDRNEFNDGYNQQEWYVLWGMNIDSDYQRAGIGMEMLRLGEEYFESIVYPEVGTENYPTTEGAALLNAAKAMGIIKAFNNHSDYEDDEYNDYEPDFDMAEINEVKHETITTDVATDEKNIQEFLDNLLKNNKKKE